MAATSENTTIERPTIQTINAIANNSGEGAINPATTNNAVQPQQIPLSINKKKKEKKLQQQQQYCCACCSLKPASYSTGLYNIDYKMYNISYLLFSLFTIYPDTVLYTLSRSYQGLYLPTISLIFFFIASLFMFFKRDNKISDSINRIRGSLFILGGLFYFVGYIVHAVYIHNICLDCDQYEWSYERYEKWSYTITWDCGFDCGLAPEPVYLIGRGIFVGFHAIFIGLLYVSNKTFVSCLHSRKKLIRCWTLLFSIFSSLVLCWILYACCLFSTVGVIVVPSIILITLSLNCCLIKKSNEAGGCTSGVSLGVIIISAYYVSLLYLVPLIIGNYQFENRQQGSYIIWDLSILLFGSMHSWILSRAMSPVNAYCGCNMDGSGDGNVGI